jgi:hypothetical protein
MLIENGHCATLGQCGGSAALQNAMAVKRNEPVGNSPSWLWALALAMRLMRMLFLTIKLIQFKAGD